MEDRSLDPDIIHLPSENFGIVSDGESVELENKIIVGNLNIFSETGAVDRILIPVNPNTQETIRYCFIEFNTHQEAEFAKEKINGQRLGKSDYVLEEWVPPQTTYTPEENLQKWLGDENRKDQFVIRASSVTKVLWNNASQSLTDLVYNKRWPPMGTYLARVHRQGVAIWGGATTLNCLMRPEKVVVNIFDVRTGAIMRCFKGNKFVVGGTRGVGGVSWLVVRWGGEKDEKCFARTRKNVVSVYETQTFPLVDKKSIKVKCVIDLTWSPTNPIIILAGLKGLNGQLGFYDVYELQTVAQCEHFMATDVQWDPSRRYVVTSVTSVHEMENSINCGSFNGKLVYKILGDHLFLFSWRPRPPYLLSPEKEEEISKLDFEKRMMMTGEWDRWMSECKGLHKEEKLKGVKMSACASSRQTRIVHGTTIMFAIWPDHISAACDGRSTTEHVFGNDISAACDGRSTTEHVEGNQTLFNHINSGNEKKLCMLGSEHIVSLAGICRYSERAYEKLVAEINSGKTVKAAVQAVDNDYVRNFKQDDDDSTLYTEFPFSICIVGFDEIYSLGKELISIDEKIGGKDVKFLFCGTGSPVAQMHLEEQRMKRDDLDNIEAISELVVECIVASCIFDPCSGGDLDKIEFQKGRKPEFSFRVRPHMISQIANKYEHVKGYLEFTFLIIAYYHPDLDSAEHEYNFQRGLLEFLPEINDIQILGVNKDTNFAVRLICFESSDIFEEAMRRMCSAHQIKGHDVYRMESLKGDFEYIMKLWDGQEKM